MTNPDELSEEIRDALDELCDQGSEALDEEDPEEALMFFQQALALLPEPAEEWGPYGWLQAAMGDAWYALNNIEQAYAMFRAAYDFAGPDEASSFVLLRLGQCARRLGETEKALAYLRAAHAIDGDDAFAEAPDCLAFLRQTDTGARQT